MSDRLKNAGLIAISKHKRQLPRTGVRPSAGIANKNSSGSGLPPISKNCNKLTDAEKSRINESRNKFAAERAKQKNKGLAEEINKKIAKFKKDKAELEDLNREFIKNPNCNRYISDEEDNSLIPVNSEYLNNQWIKLTTLQNEITGLIEQQRQLGF